MKKGITLLLILGLLLTFAACGKKDPGAQPGRTDAPDTQPQQITTEPTEPEPTQTTPPETTTPPTTGWNFLGGENADLVVKVPAESVDAYSKAEGWKEYNIEAIE